MVGNVHYSLSQWDVSLGHAVEMELECGEEVMVGHVGVESYDVYGDKPHPIPERPALLECTQHVSGVLDVAEQAGNVALHPVVHELGQTLEGFVYTWHDRSP